GAPRTRPPCARPKRPRRGTATRLNSAERGGELVPVAGDRSDTSLVVAQVHPLVRRMGVTVGLAETEEHDRQPEGLLEARADRDRSPLPDVQGRTAEGSLKGSCSCLRGARIE